LRRCRRFGVERQATRCDPSGRIGDGGDFLKNACRGEGEDAGAVRGQRRCEVRLKRRPCGVEQGVLVRFPDAGAGDDRGAEQMQLAAGARAGYVE
jgi:hypothetical protein